MNLGMILKHMQLHKGIRALSMSPSKYVKEALRICKEYVTKHPRAKNPFAIVYCSKSDESSVLGPDEASYYQSLIEIIRCQSVLTMITFSNAKTGSFGGGTTYYG